MTVAELIEALKAMPQDEIVYTTFYDPEENVAGISLGTAVWREQLGLHHIVVVGVEP